MLKNFKNISLALIFLLPISLISGPAIPDISISFIAIIFFIFILLEKNFEIFYKFDWIAFSIIFWLYLLLISFFAENKLLSFRDASIFIRILFIPFFIFLWIDNKKSILILSLVIFTSVLFVCFDSIYQFLDYNPIQGFGKDIFGYIPEFYGRLTGPFKDLVPGAYISKFCLLGLAFPLIYLKNKNFKNTLIIFYITLSGIVIYISGERMALATFTLGFILLILLFKENRIVFLITLLFILISCSLIKSFHPFYNDYKIIESNPYHLGMKIEKSYDCDNIDDASCKKKVIDTQPSFVNVLKNFDKSAYGQIYSLSINMWKDNPVLGIGLNNFTYLCRNDIKYIGKMQNIDCVTHPHNFYLQWLVETGIFGLIFFIFYLFLIFRFVIKRIHNDLSILSFVTLIILFWPIMSTGSLLKNWMGVSTFFLIGICLAYSNFKQKNE